MKATEWARRRPWVVFGLLALTQFIVVLDTSIVYVALPPIARDLHMGQVSLAWVMDAYILAFGGFMLAGGRAADLLGRRRVLLAGLGLFLLASLACGLAAAPWQLVAARVAQGLAAAVISPAAMALVIDTFADGPQRYKALGLFGGIGGIAGASGVLFGGLLTSVGWQWAFLVNVPLAVLLLVVVPMTVPVGDGHPGGRIDLPGALAGTAGVCLLLFGVLGLSSRSAATTVVVFAVAAALLAAFTARQLRAAEPLIPRMLLRLRTVVVGNLANAATGALMFGVFFVVTLYLQQVRGYLPLEAAVRTVPISVALFAGSQLGIRAFGRIAPVRALAGGLLIQAAGLGWLAAVLNPAAPVLTTFVLPGVLWGVGVGVSIVAAFVLCTSGLHGPVQGAASGLVNTTLQIGGAVGVALLGVLAAGGSGAHTVVPGLTTGAAAAAVLAVLAAAATFLVRTRPKTPPTPPAQPRSETELVTETISLEGTS